MIVTIGDREFPSKKAAEDACRAVLYAPGIDDAGQAFLHDLLEMHRQRDEKVGCGIARFYVDTNEYKNKCFWFLRIDGTRDFFSFKVCITYPTIETEARCAFRNAIRPQIARFKDLAFGGENTIRCAITGKHITRDKDAHVDHRPPTTFLKIMSDFLSMEGVALDAVKTTRGGGIKGQRTLSDAGMLDRWLEFHEDRAILQITCASANLSQGAGR